MTFDLDLEPLHIATKVIFIDLEVILELFLILEKHKSAYATTTKLWKQSTSNLIFEQDLLVISTAQLINIIVCDKIRNSGPVCLYMVHS